MKRLNYLLLGLIPAFILLGCSKEVEDKGPPPPPNPLCQATLKFSFNSANIDLAFDTVKYTNAFGNIYSVSTNTLGYLISDVRLVDWEANFVNIGEHHLVNTADETSMTWQLQDSIRTGDYTSMSFFFGTLPPGTDSDLDNVGWGTLPQYGNGYYIIKMAGEYLSNASSTSYQNYDLGLMDNILTYTQTDTSYQPNTPTATMLNGGFEIPEGTKTVEIEVEMNLNKLFEDAFRNPNYDFDQFPGNIEQNAAASKILSENISNCFRIGTVTIDGINDEEQ